MRLFLVGLLAACAALTARPGAAGEKAPALPKALALPEGYREVQRAEAEGVQIYKAERDPAGGLKWAHQAPLASLHDGNKKVGIHYAGPAWEALDGSKVAVDRSV